MKSYGKNRSYGAAALFLSGDPAGRGAEAGYAGQRGNVWVNIRADHASRVAMRIYEEEYPFEKGDDGIWHLKYPFPGWHCLCPASDRRDGGHDAISSRLLRIQPPLQLYYAGRNRRTVRCTGRGVRSSGTGGHGGFLPPEGRAPRRSAQGVLFRPP